MLDDAFASDDNTGGGMLEFICVGFFIRGAEILPTFRAGRTVRGGCTSVLGPSAARRGGSDGTTGGSVGTFSTGVLATGSTGFASAEVLTIGALATDGTAKGAGSAA